MTNTSWIARLLKWLFAICTVICVVCAVAVIVVMVIDPKLSSLVGNTTIKLKIMGQDGLLILKNSNAMADLMNGNVNVRVRDAVGLFEVIKNHGLPLALLFIVFYAALFDLLRRLFRNVVRGDSFTRGNVRLVQVIGLALVVFSFVAAGAESWFQYALSSFLSSHATASVGGAPLSLPSTAFVFDSDGSFAFGDSHFFTGLLVLALSEVFRQGFVLKAENDLTV
jgi:hypothetical protein